MNYLRSTLFGDSQQQENQHFSENDNSEIIKPSETIPEKQLLDRTDVFSFKPQINPLSEGIEAIKTRKQLITALNLQIADLTQNCCKYKDLCEANLNHVEPKICKNQECNGQHETVNKTDENKTEKELEESKKINQFLIHECEKHKKNLEELRRYIIENIAEDEQEEILTWRDSLSKKQERISNLNEEINVLNKRIHALEVDKAKLDNDNVQLLKHCERLIEENQKLNAQIVNLEKEAADRFFKQVHVVVDESMVRVEHNFNSLKAENQKISVKNKQLLSKISELEKSISEFELKEKQAQENIHRLLVENHDLESSKKYFKCKYKRVEDDHQKLIKKYINMVDKLEQQAKEKEILEKEHQAKINYLLKNMDQFKENAICRVESKNKRLEVENQKLSLENHDFRFKMLDIAVRDIMGLNIKSENGCSVSQYSQ